MEPAPPPIVVALVNDLFFAVKLGQEIRRAGFTPQIVKTLLTFIDALNQTPPVLGIIDLAIGVDWDALSAGRRNGNAGSIPIIAFGPHKDVEKLQAAREAGITRVMSNSVFHRQTAEMIRRYATTNVDAAE